MPNERCGCVRGEDGTLHYECAKHLEEFREKVRQKTRYSMTPEQRAYDDWIQSKRTNYALSVVLGLNPDEPDCCSCHISAPCGYCTKDVDNKE